VSAVALLAVRSRVRHLPGEPRMGTGAASAAARRSIGRSKPFRLVGGCAERVLALERESPAGETVVWTGACGADGRAIGQGL